MHESRLAPLELWYEAGRALRSAETVKPLGLWQTFSYPTEVGVNEIWKTGKNETLAC